MSLFGMACLFASSVLALAPGATAGTHGTVTYEADCTTALQAGSVVPFVAGLSVNASPDPSAPTGATFGATGTATVTLVGPVVAGIQSSVVAAASLGASISETIGSTDATATGTFLYTHTFATQPSSATPLSAPAAPPPPPL